MGTEADLRRRQNIRQDKNSGIIERVRRWIFEKGYLVAGEGVAKLLREYSWVPTRVFFLTLSLMAYWLKYVIECIFKIGSIRIQFLLDVRT